MMHPTYTQQGTIAKEYHNSILVTYSSTLKSATGNGLEITNVATYRQRKKNSTVQFNTPDTESYPKLLQKKQNNDDKQDDQENN